MRLTLPKRFLNLDISIIIVIIIKGVKGVQINKKFYISKLNNRRIIKSIPVTQEKQKTSLRGLRCSFAKSYYCQYGYLQKIVIYPNNLYIEKLGFLFGAGRK